MHSYTERRHDLAFLHEHTRADWKIVSVNGKDLTFRRHFVLFFNIIPLNVYTLLPAMLKGLNAAFKQVLFLTVQNVLHCMYDVIIWLKMGTRNAFFNLMRIKKGSCQFLEKECAQINS